MEMPGISKEQVQLKAGSNYLTVKAEGESRKYKKRIELPHEIDKKSVKASYRNGILELKLKTKAPSDEGESEIKVH